MTEPARGTLDVVLKQDSDNSPCCVYNEMVALRLAQRLGIPVAMGVPSVGDGGIYFASLTVGGLSINLPFTVNGIPTFTGLIYLTSIFLVTKKTFLK